MAVPGSLPAVQTARWGVLVAVVWPPCPTPPPAVPAFSVPQHRLLEILNYRITFRGNGNPGRGGHTLPGKGQTVKALGFAGQTSSVPDPGDAEVNRVATVQSS